MTNIESIKIKSKVVKLHKSVKSPILTSKNVLTNSPWDFVELWMKKEKHKTALFYWKQAKEFHDASKGLPMQSAPLLHYYSFMNAVKALLSAKAINYNPYHGVRSNNLRANLKSINITNEGVQIMNSGILPSLSTYYGETEVSLTHSLQELLFNLPYIHRSYCLTYPRQTDMYIPIKNSEFVINKDTRKAFFRAWLSKDFSNGHVVKRLPPEFILDLKQNGGYIIRSVAEVPFSTPSRATLNDERNLITLHNRLRHKLFYINGSQALWYIKSHAAGPRKIARFPATITLAIMHRLSEISRYKPLELRAFLEGKQNWLLSEFIQQSPNQFIDEIASEITGHQFLIPNVRTAE